MKHIKIFEDYSEEEINSLRDDLYSIGSDERFQLGKDLGFGRDFNEPIDGNFFPLISEELFQFLLNRKIIKQKENQYSNQDFTFSNNKDFGIPDNYYSRILEFGISNKEYVIQVFGKAWEYHVPERESYIPIFMELAKNLGNIKK